MLQCFRTETSRERGAGQAGDAPRAGTIERRGARVCGAGRAVRPRLRAVRPAFSQARSGQREIFAPRVKLPFSPRADRIFGDGGRWRRL